MSETPETPETPESVMRGRRGNRTVLVAGWVCRLLLAAVFLYAGVIKVADVQSFYIAILNFKVVGPATAAWIAVYLPWLEILVGAGLVLPSLVRGALLWTFGLLTGFLAMLAQAWIRGIDIECGCFGPGAGRGAPEAIAMDLVLLGIAWFAARSLPRSLPLN